MITENNTLSNNVGKLLNHIFHRDINEANANYSNCLLTVAPCVDRKTRWLLGNRQIKFGNSLFVLNQTTYNNLLVLKRTTSNHLQKLNRFINGKTLKRLAKSTNQCETYEVTLFDSATKIILHASIQRQRFDDFKLKHPGLFYENVIEFV